MGVYLDHDIQLILIRHGATLSNQQHRYLGKTEESLSETGRAHLIESRKRQCYPEVDCVFVSPMKRCMETAQILYPDADPVKIDEWREMDFGKFEGRNYQELTGEEEYQKWIDSNGTLPFPDGESREEFLNRCKKGFWRMVESLSQMPVPPSSAGLIVHGGTIMALLSTLCKGEYYDYQVTNGAGYQCTLHIRDGRAEILHLERMKAVE